MNIVTVCRLIGLAITLLGWFDKQQKFGPILEMLQVVESKLCGTNKFGAAPESDAKTEATAAAVADFLKTKCDCDDCEC